MHIEVVNIVPAKTEQKGNNSYQILEVAYKTPDGKVQGKKLVSFSNPEVFQIFSKAQRGEFYTVEAVKEGKYWNWKAATNATTGTASAYPSSTAALLTPPKGTGRVTGSNYETSEEREWNRTRIGRQACLNTSVALLGDTKPDVAKVIKTAEQLEAWVLRKIEPTKQEAIKALGDMADDIPY